MAPLQGHGQQVHAKGAAQLAQKIQRARCLVDHLRGNGTDGANVEGGHGQGDADAADDHHQASSQKPVLASARVISTKETAKMTMPADISVRAGSRSASRPHRGNPSAMTSPAGISARPASVGVSPWVTWRNRGRI